MVHTTKLGHRLYKVFLTNGQNTYNLNRKAKLNFKEFKEFCDVMQIT